MDLLELFFFWPWLLSLELTMRPTNSVYLQLKHSECISERYIKKLMEMPYCVLYKRKKYKGSKSSQPTNTCAVHSAGAHSVSEPHICYGRAVIDFKNFQNSLPNPALQHDAPIRRLLVNTSYSAADNWNSCSLQLYTFADTSKNVVPLLRKLLRETSDSAGVRESTGR